MNRPKTVIGVLVVIILIMGGSLVYTIREKNIAEEQGDFLQQVADQSFQYQLGQLDSCFQSGGEGGGFTSCAATAAAVSGLSALTSFEKSNDALDLTLDSLYRILLDEEKQEKLAAHGESLSVLVNKLQRQPSDAAVTEQLQDEVYQVLR